MTVNVCRDLGRSKQRRWRVFREIEDPNAVCAVDKLDPHTVLAKEQQRQVLWIALSKLPEKERTALVLRDLEGLSTAEVARILGSTESTIRVQISSAHVKVRKALRGERP